MKRNINNIKVKTNSCKNSIKQTIGNNYFINSYTYSYKSQFLQNCCNLNKIYEKKY